jgi:hypothetical protein
VRLGQARLVDGEAHRAHPRVALGGPDAKRRVAHAQPRVPTLVGVGRRPAPVLHEKQRQPVLGRTEILLGIQRPQEVVVRDLRVEARDDPAERRLAADDVIEGLHRARS